MISSKKIKIKDLKKGMKIKTLDPFTKEIVYREVEDVWETTVPTNQQVVLRFENGAKLQCSTNHPIMVNQNGQIIQKYPLELTPSDIIITDDGEHTYIIQRSFGNNDSTYIDITVSDTNTFFAQDSLTSPMVLTHNSQGGVRGGAATLTLPIWHQEIEDVLVLKNNKGSEDNRVRRIDYCIQFSKLFYERYLKDQKISLFSPHDVPDLYEAFFSDQNEFKKLYIQYEKNPNIKKKKVKATHLIHKFLTERVETGRVYFMNVDHVNDHSSFTIPIYMTNLCVAGDSAVTIMTPDLKNPISVKIEDLGFYLMKYNSEVQILSHDIKTREDKFCYIEAFAKTHPIAEVITIEDVDTGYIIKCTPNHEIFTKNRGYVRADELLETDVLQIRE